MGADSVVLTVEEGSTEGHYSFVCPICRSTIEKRADRKIVMLLLSAGVEVHEVPRLALATAHPSLQGRLPEEQDEETSDAPPFTTDDLIDFHFLLQRSDWFEQLLTVDR